MPHLNKRNARNKKPSTCTQSIYFHKVKVCPKIDYLHVLQEPPVVGIQVRPPEVQQASVLDSSVKIAPPHGLLPLKQKTLASRCKKNTMG